MSKKLQIEPISGSVVLLDSAESSGTGTLTSEQEAILNNFKITSEGKIKSDADIIADKVYFNNNSYLADSINALSSKNDHTGKNSLMLAQTYDSSGESPATSYKLEQLADVTISGAWEVRDSATFSLTVSQTRLIHSIKLNLVSYSGQLRPLKYTVRHENSNGKIIAEFDGNIQVESNGAAYVRFSAPWLVVTGEVYWVTMETAAIQGGYINSVYVPSIVLSSQDVTYVPLATESYVDTKLLNVPEFAAYVDSSITTNCLVADDWYLVALSSTFFYYTISHAEQFVADGDAIKYIGNVPIRVAIIATWTGSHDNGASRYVSWAFKKNGVFVACAKRKSRIEANDPGSISTLVPSVTLQPNDTIELYTSLDRIGVVKTSRINLLIK